MLSFSHGVLPTTLKCVFVSTRGKRAHEACAFRKTRKSSPFALSAVKLKLTSTRANYPSVRRDVQNPISTAYVQSSLCSCESRL